MIPGLPVDAMGFRLINTIIMILASMGSLVMDTTMRSIVLKLLIRTVTPIVLKLISRNIPHSFSLELPAFHYRLRRKRNNNNIYNISNGNHNCKHTSIHMSITSYERRIVNTTSNETATTIRASHGTSPAPPTARFVSVLLPRKLRQLTTPLDLLYHDRHIQQSNQTASLWTHLDRNEIKNQAAEAANGPPLRKSMRITMPQDNLCQGAPVHSRSGGENSRRNRQLPSRGRLQPQLKLKRSKSLRCFPRSLQHIQSELHHRVIHQGLDRALRHHPSARIHSMSSKAARKITMQPAVQRSNNHQHHILLNKFHLHSSQFRRRPRLLPNLNFAWYDHSLRPFWLSLRTLASTKNINYSSLPTLKQI